MDFAFAIHSKLGSKCIGAKVNGKNAQLKQTLNSGDQVEVMTSKPTDLKRDRLNIATTSKARTKIRQAIKEIEARQTEFAKETIERKFKNRKLEYDEAVMMRLIKNWIQNRNRVLSGHSQRDKRCERHHRKNTWN